MPGRDYLDELIETNKAHDPEFAALWEGAEIELHLIRARMDAGLTQSELAGRLEMTQPQVARLEKNMKGAKLEKVMRYAKEVGLTLTFQPQNSPDPPIKASHAPRGSYVRKVNAPLIVNEKRPDSI